MSSLLPADIAAYNATLARAIAAFRGEKSQRPVTSEVVNALLEAEKIIRQQHYRFSLESLSGQWRLWFTTGVRKQKQGGIRLGNGFYLPKFAPAYIGFTTGEESDRGTITNQIQLGGLLVKFTGPFRYHSQKNLLAFDFTELQVTLWGRSLYKGSIRRGKSQGLSFDQQPIAKLPFFAFFYASPEGIAARGRGGGLALWIQEPLNN